MENIWHKVIAGRVQREPIFSRPTRINSHSVEVFYRMMVFFFAFFLTERTRIKQLAFLAGP